MKTHIIKTQFVFAGCFKIKAITREEAKKIVKENCGLVMGGKIHTSLNEATVDWDFPIHPDTRIK